MPATLKDVAALAKVSLTTASHALNGKSVNEKTRERVVEAAKKLKYHTSSIGRNLIKNQSNTIGMFILNSKRSRDMTEEISYYYAMLKGALSMVQQHGYEFSFEVVDWEDIENTDYFEKKVYGRSLDGMIIVPQFEYNYGFLPTLDAEQFPYVIINPCTGIKPQNRVVMDNYKGAYLAAEHLISLGHSEIAFINGPKDHHDARVRERGFLAALLEKGIKFDRKNILYSDFTNEGGAEAMKQILGRNSGTPSAVFCANDYMASGAMAAIYDAGMRIPKDVSVTGYDDTDISRVVYPRLTTIRSAIKEMGFKAAERVIDLVEKNGDAGRMGEIVLEPRLIVRNSTALFK